MAKYTAEQRALFESQAIPFYEEIISAGGIASTDPRLRKGRPDRRIIDLLAEMDLVFLDESGGRWVPQDPASAQAQVVTPMSLEGARLLEESSAWTKSFATLGQAWRSATSPSASGPFTYVRGKAIAPYLLTLVAECQQELLTAQPQDGRETGAAYTVSVTSVERDFLARGGVLHTLYQHSARRSAATREYVAAVTELGGEIRTQDEFFNRMIVADRRLAVIPAPDDLSVAMVISEPTVVAYLTDVFLRSWERARPFDARDDRAVRQIATEQREMTMRMLIEGHSDPAAAKRLGVSARTYAGYVADLKEEFDAETRFQLGYAIGREGIRPEHLGRDAD